MVQNYIFSHRIKTKETEKLQKTTILKNSVPFVHLNQLEFERIIVSLKCHTYNLSVGLNVNQHFSMKRQRKGMEKFGV
jgi:hypothetical protein